LVVKVPLIADTSIRHPADAASLSTYLSNLVGNATDVVGDYNKKNGGLGLAQPAL
jgi:hypothetical protein